MMISAPLRPGTPNGLAAGPLRNVTMPTLTGAAAGAAGCCARPGSAEASMSAAASVNVRPANIEVWIGIDCFSLDDRNIVQFRLAQANAIPCPTATAIRAAVAAIGWAGCRYDRRTR